MIILQHVVDCLHTCGLCVQFVVAEVPRGLARASSLMDGLWTAVLERWQLEVLKGCHVHVAVFLGVVIIISGAFVMVLAAEDVC